jgi:hypothetical protein
LQFNDATFNSDIERILERILEYVVENDLSIAISTGHRESKSAIRLVERMRPDNRSFHSAVKQVIDAGMRR